MINGRARLHVLANGTMTGQRYIDEVLLAHVRLFRGAVSDKFVFMDDNATCHRTLAVQDCLDSEGIQRLVWSASSPDLNPIKNVWDALGRQVAGRNYPPTNKNTLIRALTEEWDKLPQQLLDNVVQSMEYYQQCQFCAWLQPLQANRPAHFQKRLCLHEQMQNLLRSLLLGRRVVRRTRAQTSAHWCGVVVRREGCLLRCHLRHLTMIQNYEVRRQKSSCDVNTPSLTVVRRGKFQLRCHPRH
ncbi:transposable element Tc1 transposase [Trichonephila clavipes]|nr:transposable element Tc1 transposase [Trichonephila clavipes]